MTKTKYKIPKGLFLFAVSFCLILAYTSLTWAARPKPIVIKTMDEALEERMKREITLDVRDMNIVDVLKFLALKGEFNVVISPQVNGRVTVLLKSVSIKNALDIVVISNALAYIVEDENIIQIMTTAEYEAMFGKKFSDKTEVSIIRLKYAKPSYVLATLDSIKSNIGKIIIDEDTGSVVIIDTPEAIVKMKDAIKEIEKPLDTFIFPLQYATAEIVADKLRAKIDAKAVGSVTADERTNRLIVRAFPDRKKEIEKLVKELDTPTKEVLVDSRILQITLKPEYDMGVDWQLDFRDSSDHNLRKLEFQNIYMDKDNLASADNLSSHFGQIGVGNFTNDAFEMTLRALKQVSDTKMLANPQILVTNREEAKIHIGDTVPYIISTTSGTGENAITSEDVRFVDVGLKINVTPIINDDGYVTMRLRPEISSVIGTVTSQGGGIPQVNKTEVETTVMLKDGYTVVLAGLKKNDKVHTKKGLPVLMDMPLIGFMFGRTYDHYTQQEVVVLITPHIMAGKDDYLRITPGIKPFKSYSSD